MLVESADVEFEKRLGVLVEEKEILSRGIGGHAASLIDVESGGDGDGLAGINAFDVAVGIDGGGDDEEVGRRASCHDEFLARKPQRFAGAVHERGGGMAEVEVAVLAVLNGHHRDAGVAKL